MKINMDHSALQTVAVTTIGGAILTWWPVIVALPGAFYYCLLIAEKLTGKTVREWFKKNETR